MKSGVYHPNKEIEGTKKRERENEGKIKKLKDKLMCDFFAFFRNSENTFKVGFCTLC